jgi:hypothetical protein
MKKITSLSFFGIALAVMLSFGVPGNANAFVNDTNGRLILVGGLDISIGGGGVGVDIDRDKVDRHEMSDHEREKDRDRTYDQDRARDRERDQRRDYNRENAERTYDSE